jgi:hypothetical protein
VKPLLAVVAIVACAAVAARTADGKAGCGSLAHRLPRFEQRLPVAIAVTTPCGWFLVERSGAVLRSRPAPPPVPAGAGWYPADLTWYRVVRGHLLIGVRHRFLWRSARPLATRYDLGAIARGPGRIAFSLLDGSASRLFVARLRGSEQLVGRGETPIGWTRSGDLVAARFRQLRSEDRAVSRWILLAPSGRLLRRIADDVGDWAWAEHRRALYLLAHRRVERFDGSSLVPLASLDELRIGAAPRLTALGHVLAVSDTKRIAVVDVPTGAVVATARLPRQKTPESYGAIAANADGTAIAFTWSNLAAASADPSVKGAFDTVYLLRAHAQGASVLARVPITYPTCDEGSSLVWRGQSLVYTETGGHALIFRPLTKSPAIKLTPLITRLSGNYVAEPIDFTVKR